MKRIALYSDSRSRQEPAQASLQAPVEERKPAAARSRWRRATPFAAGAAALLVLASAAWFVPRGMTPGEVNAVVQHAIQNAPVKPTAADAYQKILPSVVNVRAYFQEAPEPRHWRGRDDHPEVSEGSVGTGVVIVDNGVILTNLHVVNGANRVVVTFSNGLQSEADIVGARPETDLAVLKARKVPVDLFPATLRSTAGLRPGEEVVAVGFPFGIGPSASAGVVSGLKREYESQGKRVLTNLIQFDAAVNPGNSGGPLVTLDGEVVGIVTGLLNPTEQRVFVGIGFAVPIENAASSVGLDPF